MVDIKALVKFLQDNKLKNVSVYSISDSSSEKYIVLASSMKATDSKKCADAVVEKYGYEGKIEGYNKGEWVVFDFQNLTLHIFLPKIREKYNLDKLYKPKKISI